jgi:5-oxoprolinase (ATP-hydrolysing)
MKSNMIWRFAIDVGGTFTDCVALSPAGESHTAKVLSSGVCKGRINFAQSADEVTDPSRKGEPDDLWQGATITFYPKDNSPQSARITSSDGTRGTLKFDQSVKCLSDVEDPPIRYDIATGEPAPLVAIRQILGLPVSADLPTLELRLGTTRGTNALLTRSGARTALITTLGFQDALTIGYQNRPRLFDLDIIRPKPLYEAVLEVDERISSTGEPLRAPNLSHLQPQLQHLRAQGIDSVAICLLNAYLNPDHETLVAETCRDTGFKNISISHQVAPLIKLIERGQTTVTDAYLNPILSEYLQSIASRLSSDSTLKLMTSSGDLVAIDHFSGKDSLLSGPAGGVVALANLSQKTAEGRGIGFDMGGTSTDVSRFDGKLELDTETVKADLSIYAPTLSIETVAAGGGSVCWYESGMLRVGPQSAGADPGPACYGRGGPLAVTDLNVWLGRVAREQFPFALDLDAIERQLESWRERLRQDGKPAMDLTQLALGWLQIANSKMADAIRRVSVVKGYDPRDFALIAFGGAAGQHACAVADELGMRRVLFPQNASLLSAVGMSLAPLAGRAIRGVYQPIASNGLDEFETTFQDLQGQAEDRLKAQGFEGSARIKRTAEIRYTLTEASLLVDEPADRDYIKAFEQQHQQQFGYLQNRGLELCSLQVVASDEADATPETECFEPMRQIEPRSTVSLDCCSGPIIAGVIARDELCPGDFLSGPAMVYETTSTIVVDPGWELRVLPSGHLELRRDQSHESTLAPLGQPGRAEETDPVLLEIFSNQFQAIAEQMGATLRKTASSVNVKERLDYSCALFDSDGQLVVNAPHIPVHLGAMSETVRCLIRDCPDLKPGEAYLTNDPYLGGSHLPDLTVVSPVFVGDSSAKQRPTFFVASRAHHAEIGGITPGSMPPFSKRLGEEGVIFRHLRIADAGGFHTEALKMGTGAFFEANSASQARVIAEFPSRAPDENINDIQAQLAANVRGIRELEVLCRQKGTEVVLAYMKQLQKLSRSAMSQVLGYLGDGKRTLVDQLDDGSRIAVTAAIKSGRLSLDFSGTSGVHPGNFNANPGIVTAAVMYVLRCLLTHGDELGRTSWCREFRSDASLDDLGLPTVSHVPLNHGLLELVDLHIPHGMLNPPASNHPADSPAVVGGNVETSQRIVDVLLGVFGIAAGSQGTMNNLLFGDAAFGYYETICGGAGATCFSSGASAVHTHMTNTRITDPEVMESRFPVRLLQFSIRLRSGGKGRYSGGDGAIREIEFLKDLDVSLLTNRRASAPIGLDGGQPGQPGHNLLYRSNLANTCHPLDSPVELGSSAHLHVKRGDVLRLETPGGGGFGTGP